MITRHPSALKNAATDKANSWDHSVDNSGDPDQFPEKTSLIRGKSDATFLLQRRRTLVWQKSMNLLTHALYSETTPEHSLRSETTSESENLYTYPAHLLTNTSPPNPTELFDDAFYATPDKPKFCEHYYAEIRSDIVPDPGGFRN